VSGEVVCIADWARFRHYKDRAVGWIKVGGDLLMDVRFHNLSAELKGQFIGLLLLSARLQDDPNQTPELPADPEYLGQVCGTEMTKTSLEKLLDSGLVVLGPVPPLMDRKWKSRYVPKDVKAAVLKRDGRCLKCGDPDRLEIDHIIPVSEPELIDRLLCGNAADPSNLQTLCRACNRSKRFAGHGALADWALSDESDGIRSALSRTA